MSKAIVIGAGIMGLSTAYYLSKRGIEVTVIDKSDLNNNCSYGNAGYISPSHIIPLAAPKIVSKGLRWLLNPSSPFSVQIRPDPELIRWFILFYKHANEEHVERSIKPLLEIMLLSYDLYHSLKSEEGMNFFLKDDGIFEVYKNPKTAEGGFRTAAKARELGLEAISMDMEEARKLEPLFQSQLQSAVLYKCDSHLHPNEFMQLFKLNLMKKGVNFICNETVARFNVSVNKITSIETTGNIYNADHFILNTGAYSAMLLKKVGYRLPLQPGKGYSMTLDHEVLPVKYPAILVDSRVAITPVPGKIRIGGTLEVGFFKNKINRKKIEGIINAVPAHYQSPAINIPDDKDIWQGLRPCSVDGLPYIGKVGRFQNLYIGTGHAMLGMTLGPATGKLLQELITGDKASITMDPYNPNRFT